METSRLHNETAQPTQRSTLQPYLSRRSWGFSKAGGRALHEPPARTVELSISVGLPRVCGAGRDGLRSTARRVS